MADIKVTATVRLHKEESGFFIDASLDAEFAGVDQQQAEALVAKAHTICPYSKATRGNIELKLMANGKAVEGGYQLPCILLSHVDIQGMAPGNINDFSSLVADPRESLGVEIKSWIGTETDEDKAKIVRACIALRNNDGGVLLIGFKNDGTPDKGHEPTDVRAAFHPDRIQALIGKYVSIPFETRVEFIKHAAIEYPAVVVPSGLTSPIACKADLPHDGKLLRANTVYVRTLHANHTVSSSPAIWSDWPDVAARCFANREADIGAFVRRHLLGLDPSALANSIRTLSQVFEEKSLPILAQEYLEIGFQRFEVACNKRKLKVPAEVGFRAISIVVDPQIVEKTIDKQLLWQLDASRPRYSGWPPWINVPGRGIDDPLAPYVLDGGWEALVNERIIGQSLDFWRIEPNGKFYHVSAFDEDVGRNTEQSPKPYTVLVLQQRFSLLSFLVIWTYICVDPWSS